MSDNSACRFGDECMYRDGPHREHAWTDAAGAVVRGSEGLVYVYSLVDADEPNEVLIGVQDLSDPDRPSEARLTVEQAADLLAILAKAVHYAQSPIGDTIVVDTTPGEELEIVCEPMEPDFPDYDGQRFLAVNFRGREEAGVFLTKDKAAQLARLLTGAP